MELDLATRRRVTAMMVRKYAKATRAEKSAMLGQLCEVNGWHRDHARKALRQAAACPDPAALQRRQRSPVLRYQPEVIEALVKVWAGLDGPTGKRLAPAMPTLVASLVAHGELDVPPEVVDQLLAMSPATIDRRLARIRCEATLRRELVDQARVAVEVADPDADLGRLGQQRAPGSSRSTWSATTAATSMASSVSP